jgi:hypothetical protein
MHLLATLTNPASEEELAPLVTKVCISRRALGMVVIGGSHFSVPTGEGLQAPAFFFAQCSAAGEGSRMSGR